MARFARLERGWQRGRLSALGWSWRSFRLVVVFMSLALGIAQLPKSSALIVSVTVGVAAMAWCLLVSQWWRQWVGTLNGVDHVAVERLARRTGLIWGRL